MNQLSEGHIFISYSRKDNDVMRRIVMFLRKEGKKVWVDNERLIPGTPIWEEEIEKAIMGSYAIIAILSPDAKNSEWVRREISMAEQRHKRIFPVLVRGDEDTSISLRLITRQFVDLRQNEKMGLKSLDSALCLYLEELIEQEQITREAEDNLVREKLAQEQAEKDARKHLEIERDEKAIREKEEIEARAKAKSVRAKPGVVDSEAVLQKLQTKMGIFPTRTIFVGFLGLLVVALVIWGIRLWPNQEVSSTPGPFTEIAETIAAQQTRGAITSTVETLEMFTSSISDPTPTITQKPTPISITHDGGERAQGINVSSYDGTIDWTQVKNSGIDFAFIYATEGQVYVDSAFDDLWIGAKSVGILRGAYHLFDPSQSASKQAERFIKTVELMDDYGDLPPVLDLEQTRGQTNEIIIAESKIWLDRVEQAFGRKPIIYSGEFFLKDYFSEIGGGPPVWARDYPLWFSQYPSQYDPVRSPDLPAGWFDWAFWQYSDRGTVDGIGANVGVNVFNGSVTELQQYLEDH